MESPAEPLRDRLFPLVEEVVLEPSAPDARSRLAELGVAVDAQGAALFARVCRELGAHRAARKKLAVVAAAMLESADPGGALANLMRYVETAGMPATVLDTLSRAKPLLDIVAAVFGASRYMADIIVRNPGYLYWLADRATWESEDTAEACEGSLLSDIASFSTAQGKLDAARRFQRRLLLKIGARDLAGAQGIEATTAALSDLAEGITRAALAVVREDLAASDPRGPAAYEGFAVLALGKLGGRELNYSSDIDLIYVCRDDDDESIAACHRLAAKLTDALSGATAEGYLYRTDLRLRPDGASGPLVNSLAAMRIYYESRAKPWEFQAMLKARVIAGNREVGEELLGYVSGLLLNPAVYGSPIEEIASMRMRIRDNISEREKAFNIKLMEGGIRDIEFILQTLQLLHGRHFPEIRTTNTMEGIRRAFAKGLIKKTEMETMTRAYLFLRLIEHRLQMMHQIKIHSIPESREEVELLARRVSQGPLGRFTYDSFISALALHLNQIRLLSESFFAGHGMPEAALLTLVPGDDGLAAEVLERHHFRDGKRALTVLRGLAYGSFPHLVDRATRASFQKLLPRLLEDCKATGDPDLTLVNFARLSEASRSERGLYDLLAASPAARLIVRNLTGLSSVLTAKLCRRPDMLDLLLEDPEFTLVAPLPPLASLSRFEERASADVAERLRRDLTDFFDRRLLAAWIIDDATGSFPRTLSGTITATVKEMISAVMERAAAEASGGAAQRDEIDVRGIALFALGSFAAGEPRIESDADLLVVVDRRDIERVTQSVYALNRVFSDAGLLKIDFRLRGEGANAPLVQDLDFYARYFKTRMASWEHIAFAKCAFWWGDRSLSDAFLERLTAAIRVPPTRERLDALVEMRHRLEALVPQGSEPFETKRSSGGRYDIEYLAVIGLAKTGAEYPLHATTPERLDALAETAAISPDEALFLREAWAFLHKIDFLLELQGFTSPNTPEKARKIAAYLDRAFECLGTPVEGGVEKRVDSLKRRVRECYRRFVPV